MFSYSEATTIFRPAATAGRAAGAAATILHRIESEVHDLRDLGPGLDDPVVSGEPGVVGAQLDELGDILGLHDFHFDFVSLTRGGYWRAQAVMWIPESSNSRATAAKIRPLGTTSFNLFMERSSCGVGSWGASPRSPTLETTIHDARRARRRTGP